VRDGQRELTKAIVKLLKRIWLFITGWFRERRVPSFFRTRVVLGEMVRRTPGGNHAWYESNVGIIRKPIHHL
jgi:hypothetical protein